MEHIDRRIGIQAAHSFGVVTLEELAAYGVSVEQVHHRVRSRRLAPLQPGVYRVAGAPRCWEGELLAAVVAAGTGAYASHHSAARLMGLRGGYADRPELTIVGPRLPLLHDARVHRIDRLDEVDRSRRFGIPCLAPPVALLGLGSRVSERTLHNAVHDAVFQGITTTPLLVDVLRRLGGRGRRGTAPLRRALLTLPIRGRRATETGLELDLARLLRVHGLPEPELQYRVTDGNGEARRLDLAYPVQRVDLEADGDRWHTSALDQADDERRDAAIAAIGYTVLRFTDSDIHHRPDHTVARVRRALQTGSLSAAGR